MNSQVSIINTKLFYYFKITVVHDIRLLFSMDIKVLLFFFLLFQNYDDDKAGVGYSLKLVP